MLSFVPPIQSTLKYKDLHSQTTAAIYKVKFMENKVNEFTFAMLVDRHINQQLK
jgi:hypothetical protein